MDQPTLTLTLTESDVLAIRAALVGRIRATDVERADDWRSAWMVYERFTGAHIKAEHEAAAESEYWAEQVEALAAFGRTCADDAAEYRRGTEPGK